MKNKFLLLLVAASLATPSLLYCPRGRKKIMMPSNNEVSKFKHNRKTKMVSGVSALDLYVSELMWSCAFDYLDKEKDISEKTMQLTTPNSYFALPAFLVAVASGSIGVVEKLAPYYQECGIDIKTLTYREANDDRQHNALDLAKKFKKEAVVNYLEATIFTQEEDALIELMNSQQLDLVPNSQNRQYGEEKAEVPVYKKKKKKKKKAGVQAVNQPLQDYTSDVD